MSESMPRKLLVFGCKPEIGEMMRLVMVRQDWQCTYVETAPAGIEQAESDPPDLIIAQIMMADIDGYTACAQMKQHPRLKSVPVLLQGALLREWVYPDAQKCGAAGYLLLPWMPRELRTVCEAVLRGETYYPSFGEN